MKFEFDVERIGLVSDGSHSFDDLYHHRMMLFAVICNTYKDKAWKSWLHDNGTMFDDYFIVGVETDMGQYTYHYHKDNWDMFEVKELEKAPAYDGHKPEDIDRLTSLYKRYNSITEEEFEEWINNEDDIEYVLEEECEEVSSEENYDGDWTVDVEKVYKHKDGFYILHSYSESSSGSCCDIWNESYSLVK